MSVTDLVKEAEAIQGRMPISRRTFGISAAIAAGYAAAVQPVAASTITTDSEGLTEGMIELDVDGTMIPGYRAKPEGATDAPVVLVVQEIFGLHAYIKDVCRRFAKEGFYAIAVEMYHRYGDVSSMSDFQEIFKIVAQVPDAEVMRDLDVAVEYAAGDGGDASKLGVTGFCWGGRITWLYSAHNPNVDAGVAWYGRLVGEASENNPLHPVDVAQDLNGPVLGLYGENDTGIPLDTVAAMEDALGEGSPSKFIVYDDSPHGFHADFRPSYRENDATDGWARALDWFREHMG